MFGMLSVFSEFERALIKERIASGLARARVSGLSIRETARAAGVSVGKAHGVIKEAEADAAD